MTAAPQGSVVEGRRMARPHAKSEDEYLHSMHFDAPTEFDARELQYRTNANGDCARTLRHSIPWKIQTRESEIHSRNTPRDSGSGDWLNPGISIQSM